MNQTKLKAPITQLLNCLERLLSEIQNYEIDLNEEYWDYDYYAELLEKTEKVKELLAGETGLLTKLEEYQTEQEDE